jgi:CheY-like chemotaxis protein
MHDRRIRWPEKGVTLALVLVVEDDPEIRGILCAFLRAEGHESIEAASAAEADAALEHLPDCIFLDVSMPGESGKEFLLRLRRHPKLGRTPATFVTGYPDEVLELRQQGLVDPYVLTKPFRRVQVAELVHAMLRHKRGRLDLRVRIIRDALRVTMDDEGPLVVKNLSVGGVFLLCNHKRPIGDTARLLLHFRNEELAVEARVTHCRGDGIGFAFVEPNSAFLHAVARAIDDLLTDGAIVSDRRRSVRVRVSAAVAFSDSEDRTMAQLRDISATGAYLVAPMVPQIGSKVYIYLPGYTYSEGGHERSEVRGCLSDVVRHGTDGFGCSFRGPSAEFVMAADDLMSRTAKLDPKK